MSLVQNMAANLAPPLADTSRAGPRQRWTLLRRILSQPKGAIGLTLVVLYLLLAVFGQIGRAHV